MYRCVYVSANVYVCIFLVQKFLNNIEICNIKMSPTLLVGVHSANFPLFGMLYINTYLYRDTYV